MTKNKSLKDKSLKDKSLKDCIILDIKERFLNFESFRGLLLLTGGVLFTYISLFYQQYVIQGMGVFFGSYMIIDGLRRTFVNRIKQALDKQKLIRRRKAFNVSDSKN